jgi:hypothetical protein
MLVERSGCDVRTAINTLQLLSRQHSATQQQQQQQQQQDEAASQAGARPRVTITAAAVAGSGALGLKDVASGPLALLQQLLTASASRGMSNRLQRLAAALRSEQQGQQGQGGGLTAAAAARLQLQEHYSSLLDLGEHEQVGAGAKGAARGAAHGVCVCARVRLRLLGGALRTCLLRLQVLLALHEPLPELIGLDVDLATTAAAAAALADADVLAAGGRAGAGGPGRQYVPACLLTAVALLRRDAAGVGVLLGGAGGPQLSWPRAQVRAARAQAQGGGERGATQGWWRGRGEGRCRIPACSVRQPAAGGCMRPG